MRGGDLPPEEGLDWVCHVGTAGLLIEGLFDVFPTLWFSGLNTDETPTSSLGLNLSKHIRCL